LIPLVQAQTPTRICVTPPAGLVDWWPFDEAATPAATAAQDISGAVNNASAPFLFGPTPVAGMVSNALSFDGVDDFLEVKNDPEINFLGTCGALNESFTIDVWVKPNSHAGLQMILDKRVIGATGCPVGYMLQLKRGACFSKWRMARLHLAV
jgi:hypothetical protein